MLRCLNYYPAVLIRSYKCGARKIEQATNDRRCRSGLIIVAEPLHFYADPAPGKNFDAAPDPAAQDRLLPYCIARQNF
jgi:hypothetical protein